MPNEFKGNKGEWSEIISFFKVLLGKNIFIKIFDGSYKLVKPHAVERFDGPNKKGRIFTFNDNKIYIDGQPVSFDGNLEQIIDKSFQELLTSKGTTFTLLSLLPLMEILKITSIKASNKSKKDMAILFDNSPEHQGYSVKSEIGHSGALINASDPTRLRYGIIGLPDKVNIKEINNKYSKIRGLFKYIRGLGISISHPEDIDYLPNKIYKYNLDLESTSELLYMFYLVFLERGISRIDEICKIAPIMHYKFCEGRTEKFIRNKFGRMLHSALCGMIPSEHFFGEVDASGGMAILDRHGHVYLDPCSNGKSINDKLLESVKLDTGSQAKHRFGYLYTGDIIERYAGRWVSRSEFKDEFKGEFKDHTWKYIRFKGADKLKIGEGCWWEKGMDNPYNEKVYLLRISPESHYPIKVLAKNMNTPVFRVMKSPTEYHPLHKRIFLDEIINVRFLKGCK